VAATLTPDGELTYFSFPIEKTEETADGDLIVYGKATDGTVDSDLQIVDQDWSAKAIHEWLQTGGNLRVQHQARRDPAGKGLEVEATPEGHFVKSLVVEPVAKELVRKGVLTCYSVGITLPDIVPDPTGKAMNGIIRGRRDGLTKISEISLVDRGSNFNSKFQLVKAAGESGKPEFVGKMLIDPALNGTVVTSSTAPAGSVVTPADVAKVLTGHEGVAKRNADPEELNVSDSEKAVDVETTATEDVTETKTVEEPTTVKDEDPDEVKAGSTGGGSGTSGGSAGAGDAGGGTAGAGTGGAGSVKSDDEDEGEGETEKCDDGEKAVAPTVEKVITVEKKDKVMCPGCGANLHAEHNFCPECGGKLKGALAIKKNHDFTCLGCGYQLDKGEKFCPSCGKAHPGYLPEADSKAKAVEVTAEGPTVTEDDPERAARKAAKRAAKAAAQADVTKKPTPTDGVEETEDADAVPEHREPDGPAIEALEHDAGMPTVPDSSVKAVDLIFPGDFEGSASMRLKMLNVPADYGVLHDLTCPCFHPDDVAKSYPSYDLSSLDPNHWQRKAFELAASAPLDQAHKANTLWQHVVTLKGTDPRYLMEVKSELYKEFRDANPGPGSFPTPGSINGHAYNRPLVTAGHEAASPGHGGPNTAPNPFGSISASQYDRGYVTGGHAATAPSSSGEPMRPVSAPSVTGVPTRTYYTNAMRNNARQAMLAMHDHIAQTFPDLCPTAPDGSPYGGSLPGSRPVSTGVGGPAPHGAAKAVKAAKVKTEPTTPTVDKAVETDVTKAVTLDLATVQAMITKAVADVNEIRDAEVAGLRKDLKKTRRKLDALAEQPDPVGPYRGVAFEQINKAVAPEVLPSVSRAERAQQSVFQALHDQWRNDPDPMQREVAWRELKKMTGF
jgi:hypothetical protein